MAQSRYLIIGLGRFGAALAESLAEQGAEVIAIDRDMAMVDAVKQKVAYAIELDATDPQALLSVDPLKCRTAIVAIGDRKDAKAHVFRIWGLVHGLLGLYRSETWRAANDRKAVEFIASLV